MIKPLFTSFIHSAPSSGGQLFDCLYLFGYNKRVGCNHIKPLLHIIVLNETMMIILAEKGKE